MESTLPHVTVKQKYQVTIPVVLRKKLKLQEGDMLAAEECNGTIILTPKIVVSKKRAPKKSLTKYVGSARGILSSAKKIDAFIRNERKQWDS